MSKQDELIQESINSIEEFDALTIPTSCFITFEDDFSKVVALEMPGDK